MKVIFVGIHNKPGMSPLDSRTKSGILIDRCIRALRPIECVKTNLFDIDYLPVSSNRNIHVFYWLSHINPKAEDVVVLLGNVVHRAYQDSIYIKRNIIMVKHPSSIWSREKKDQYVENIVDEINQLKQKIN